MGGEVEVNDVRLAYEEWGAGEDVLLLGPLGASAEGWRPYQVGPFVGAGFRVVALTPRGVPPSTIPEPPYTIDEMARDAAGAMERLFTGRAAVVGYSMGALIAQELALLRPDLLRGLVLLGTLARKDVMRRALFDGSLEALRSGVRLPRTLEAVGSALRLFGPATLDDDEWARTYLARSTEAGEWTEAVQRGLLGQQAATTAYDNRLDALRAVRAPTLVVGFALDLLTPASLGREVASTIPGAGYVEVPGCGHGGPWEKHAAVNPVVLDFLRRLEA